MTGMHDDNRAEPAGGTLREVASDIAGLPLGRQIVRTAVDTVIFTPRVARDIVAGTRAYFSPLRLFLSLMGALIALTAFFGLPTLFSIDALVIPEAQDRLDALLAGHGVTRLELVTTLDRWSAWLNWPVFAAGALPYILLLKAFRPSIGWWPHTQIYLLANNAMLIVILIAAPLLLVDEWLFVIANILTMALFFLVIARSGASAYGMRWPAVTGLTLASILVSIPAIILYVALSMLATHVVLMVSFGISLPELLAVNLAPDSAAETPGD